MSTLSTPLRILLLLSLALNLALGTALAVRSVSEQAAPGSVQAHRDERGAGPRHFARVLDDADRAVLLRIYEAHREQLGGRRQAMGSSRKAIAAALREEPFDPARLDAAYAAASAQESTRSLAGQAFMRELAVELSPEGRQRIADRIERGRRER